MCIFQHSKVEVYTEQPRLWPLYYQLGESEPVHRSRMFAERRERRQENIERNKKADPIGLKQKIEYWRREYDR